MAESDSAVPEFVVWLDPGLTTGWATLLQGWRFESGQDIFPDIGEILESFGEFYGGRMALGWEQYILTSGGNKSGSAGPPIEIIGLSRWLGYKYHCQMLKPVPSAMRKAVTLDHLKELGWHNPGHDHANQASRHMAAWMLRENLFTKEQKDAVFGDCQTPLE